MTRPLHAYENGGTRVELFADGTKIRSVIDPDCPPEFPEQMDLKITDWCDAGCAWCHEHSTIRGRHGHIDAMIALLSDLPAGVEIAIGGGDPLSHPEFDRLVQSLSGQGLVCNVTVNGRHVARHQSRLERLAAEKRIYGIGVSFHEDFPDWSYPHLVDHMISGVDDPAHLLSAPPRKVLVLGYKTWGRGRSFEAKKSLRIQERIAAWYRLLPLIAQRHHLSFDNLAIEQLNPRRLFASQADYDRYFMGREGQYSLYVDGVEQEYATSSYAADRAAWSDIRSMFEDVRARYAIGF